MGIPMEHLVMRQHLRLLAYGVTSSDGLEAADDAIGYSDRHRVDGRGVVRSSRRGQRVGARELSVSGHAAGALPMDDDGRCAVARAVTADEVDQPSVAGGTAPDCRSAALRVEMIPDGAGVMPYISNIA